MIKKRRQRVERKNAARKGSETTLKKESERNKLMEKWIF